MQEIVKTGIEAVMLNRKIQPLYCSVPDLVDL